MVDCSMRRRPRSTIARRHVRRSRHSPIRRQSARCSASWRLRSREMRRILNHQGTKAPRIPWCLGALVVITLLLPALQIGFLNDDISMIAFTFDDWRPNLANLFNERGLMGLYYRPLIDLTFAL